MASTPAKQKKSIVTKTKPSAGMSLFNEMERMFENFSTKGWLRPFHWDAPLLSEIATSDVTMPSVDVIDRDGEIVVKAVLPGVEKKDIDISTTKNTVTIKAETCHEEKEEKGDYYHCEISRGSYYRTVGLPADVDDKKAKAKIKDGLLELVLPKLEVSHRHTVKVD